MLDAEAVVDDAIEYGVVVGHNLHDVAGFGPVDVIPEDGGL